MQMVPMNRYLVQITEYHGEYIAADYFRESNGFVKFFIVGNNEALPKCIATYNLDKIHGWRELPK